MKEKKTSIFDNQKLKIGGILLAAALIFGVSMFNLDKANDPLPELVSVVDGDEVVEIAEDDTPLAAPKVTKKTTTSKKTKKIKLKKAAKKTYKKKNKTKTNKSVSEKNVGTIKTKTETVTQVSSVSNFKKGSKIETRVITTKVTVTKTVTSTAKTLTDEIAVKSSTPDIKEIAPKADKRVISAYKELCFKVQINPSVNYSGLFDARSQSITLRSACTTIYHELGHFVGFIAGNVDKTASFAEIYAQEKGKYTEANKIYVCSTPAEYFAESFKNYTEDPKTLKAQRPLTYQTIEDALDRITPEQVARLKSAYSFLWTY